MRIITLPGVFAPISDSRLLADALRRETLPADARVLDLCTGSGLLALTAARRGARATAVDVSRRAVLTVRLNARLNGLRVRAVRGCLFEPLAGQRFDCVVSNPPYVPSTRTALPTSGASRAWEAGPDGRVLLDRIIAEAPEHLRPGGVLLLTHTDLIGAEETLERLAAAGLEPRVVERRRGRLGPLMRRRVADGLLPAGTVEEEVMVFRGQKVAKSMMSSRTPLRSGIPVA